MGQTTCILSNENVGIERIFNWIKVLPSDYSGPQGKTKNTFRINFAEKHFADKGVKTNLLHTQTKVDIKYMVMELR